MITKLTSSLPTFKTLDFKPGLNILLAERHETSGARDTRNGTGKTSFIELVHFILSERRNPKDDFHKPELVGSDFEAIFKDDGSEFAVKGRETVQNERYVLPQIPSEVAISSAVTTRGVVMV